MPYFCVRILRIVQCYRISYYKCRARHSVEVAAWSLQTHKSDINYRRSRHIKLIRKATRIQHRRFRFQIIKTTPTPTPTDAWPNFIFLIEFHFYLQAIFSFSQNLFHCSSSPTLTATEEFQSPLGNSNKTSSNFPLLTSQTSANERHT